MGKKNLYALLGGLLLTACSGSGAGDASNVGKRLSF